MPKLLAIDDKQDNLVSISALLKMLIPGCEIVTALSGLEGLEKARTESPDTILLDIKMPEMDGYEVCKRLKASETTKHIPVIMLTAIKTDSESQIKGLETGADAFLAKPIDEYVLAAQIKTALRIKKAEDKLRQEKDTLEVTVEDRTRKLIESEERYRTLFNSTSDAIFIHDLDGRCLEVNDEACNILNYTREELQGMTAADINASDDKAATCQRMDLIKKKGELFFETVHRSRDGFLIPVEIKSRVITFDNQEYFLSIARDITERKQLEKEKQILQAQLQQAHKMEAIGTLAGGIAHDFNNILFPIIGFSEMILEDLPEENHPYSEVKEILYSATRAAELVQQILTFSRQAERETKPLRVQSILKEVLKLMRSSLPSTIEIRQKIDSDCRPILGDSSQVHQIIMNLCTNAYHAMRKKGGVLTVSLTEAMIEDESLVTFRGSNNYLILSVNDTGCGIPPDYFGRVFDPFFTTKEVGEGTGLGLSTIHGIVMSYGGNIKFSSILNEGTTFDIYLPVIDRLVEDIQKQETSLPTGSEHILVVDDEKQIIIMIKKAMERLGYRVTACSNSMEALNLFRAKPDDFDLLMTDLTMPQMTGDELAREVILVRPAIPIILLTGYSDVINREQAREMGIFDMMTKPILKNEIAHMVRDALDQRSNLIKES